MVKRADNLFGSIVIINKGVLFLNICGVVYVVFKLIKAPPSDQESHLMSVVFYILNNLLLYSCRLLFTISFMSKLSSTSDDLISTVAYSSSQRGHSWTEKERAAFSSFFGRLNQAKISACSSGFYNIKPSIGLTLLSLIVTYTIILLQT